MGGGRERERFTMSPIQLWRRKTKKTLVMIFISSINMKQRKLCGDQCTLTHFTFLIFKLVLANLFAF